MQVLFSVLVALAKQLTCRL